MFLSRLFKVLPIAIVAVVFASIATAYAAANTVPDTNVGDGAGAVSGYTITSGTVHYNLNASNPQTIDSVTFDTSPNVATGSTVRIQLVTSGSWYSCTFAGATVTCTTAGATVAASNTLRVVIAN